MVQRQVHGPRQTQMAQQQEQQPGQQQGHRLQQPTAVGRAQPMAVQQGEVGAGLRGWMQQQGDRLVAASSANRSPSR
jgi:hypothetical protein